MQLEGTLRNRCEITKKFIRFDSSIEKEMWENLFEMFLNATIESKNDFRY